MKTHLTFIITLIAVFYCFKGFTQHNPALTLVNSMPFCKAAEITLHLDGNVQVEFWDEQYLRVELTVEKSNLSRTQLKSLVKTGFFQVNSVGYSNGLLLYIPKAATPVSVNGIHRVIELRFKITVPHNTIVHLKNDEDELLALEPAAL